MAHAQTAAPEVDADDTIIVTAQRREADLQDVPAAVTAISSEEITEQNIFDVSDLQYQVPNISIAAGTGTANSARIFLRGVGEDESRGAVDPAVAIYVDGIYIGRNVGALFDVVDLAQIEVLRGPQGTLYGRNASGGAIKLVSRKPEFENGAEAGITVGNEGRFDARYAGNIAFSDQTALRVSSLYRQRDGFWDLQPNGDFAGQGGEVGDVSLASVRASLLHVFNPDWEVTFIGDYTDDQSDPIPASRAPAVDADGDIFTIEPPVGTTCSSAFPSFLQPTGCFTDFNSEVQTGGVSMDISGRLGQFEVQSLTGYRFMEDELDSLVSIPFAQETDQDQFSQEFLLSSDFDGPFNFVSGIYYYQEDVELDVNFVALTQIETDTEAFAIFGHGTYDFTEALTLTAGVRYTEEDKTFSGIGLIGTRDDERTFVNTLYNVGLDWDLTDNVMAYVSYATGFKSGGWSPDCFAGGLGCFRPVDEEEVATTEVGVRTQLFDNRLRFNATYFFNTYEGLQIGATVPDVGGFTRFNVDETEIQGFEIETRLFLTDNFSLYGNLGLLDAEYTEVTEFQAGGLTNAGAACPGGVVTIECALDLELKNAPEYKGLIGAQYEYDLRNGGNLFFNVSAAFEDESWSLVANGPPATLTDPDTLIDARIAYTPQSDRWTLALWGTNLSDEQVWRAATSTTAGGDVYASPPRQWGVDLDVRF
jgi:iron complex outermembrane receptor protein